MKCPEHKVSLVYKKTKFGPRGQCPVNGCTVVHWHNDLTATPANYETRQARHKAHEVFDPLWQSKKYRRQKLYKKLAHHLGIPIKKTHIGNFNIDQCQKTVEFASLIAQELSKKGNKSLETPKEGARK